MTATPAVQPLVSAASTTRFGKGEMIIVSLLCLIGPIGAGIYLAPLWGWVTIALLMFLYLLFLGRWISGRPLGVLVNERNLMSLSRFQMASWTILLLSAFLAIVLKRLHILSTNVAAFPLNVSMDPRLWALMGISATSLVGTPLLLSTKADQEPAPNTVTKAANALNEPTAEIQANLQGTLYSNPKVSDAKITDLFQGDEVGNTAYIDVSKLQMFYVTVVSLVVYAYALYSAIGKIYPQEGFAMPVPSTALVALLGISNAAYLTNKTIQHS
jgi:hypothetical protein